VKRASAGRAHLTTRQAAGHCRVSIPTLRRWIRAGDLGAYLTRAATAGSTSTSSSASSPRRGAAYPLGAGARTRLLVVDDESLIVAMLVDLLSAGPFTIETATDGYEALVKVGTFRRR